MHSRHLRLSSRVSCLLLILFAAVRVWAGGIGTVTGRVVDATTKAPLAGAAILVDTTTLRATTESDGSFRLGNVPEGAGVLVVSYLGKRTERASVTVQPGGVLRVEVELAADYAYKESVDVIGRPIEQGESRALNQQRAAVNITNVISADQIGAFPDTNAAEATQRIPAVSIQRDQGEGRYIMIRGTEPRLNSMMIDGERIPSTESDVRQVALDVIPADLLSSIQVTKAITPDMDADSIGGSVNLVFKQATDKLRVLFSAGGGYNSLIEDADQPNLNGAVGGRFAGSKIGLMVGGSYLKASRGSEDFEPAYTATMGLASNSLRDYTVTRKRSGLNVAFDAKAGDSTTFFVRGLYNRFSDQEYRQQVKHTVSSSRIDRQLKDRLETQHIGSFSGRVEHAFTGGATLEVRGSTAYGDEGEPNHQDTTFRQSKVVFNPNVTADSIDPNNIQANPLNENLANYTLNSIVITDGLTRDRDAVTSADLRLPLTSAAGKASFLKFGGKYRQKHKFYDVTITNKTSSTPIPMQPYLDPTEMSIYGTRYPMGPPMNAAGVRGIPSQYPLTSVPDHIKADPSNYDATEGVFAAYGMAEFYLGAKLTLVPGVRYESTNVDYAGNRVNLDASGAWVSTSELTGGTTNGVVLPMAHLRYAFDESTILRGALTRTLARPDYADLVPRETINLQNYTLSKGNPDLRPTTSWNYDLMFERYFKSVGVLSAGLFAKQLTDYIYPFETTEVRGGDTYRVTQPQNGESATVTGAEFAYQNQLRFLPGPLAGIGVLANYTFTTSSATFLGRDGETATLPGQARHVGNFAVWYERYGFSGRVSVNYHGKFIDSVGATAANDIYYDAHTQADVMLSQAITKNFRVYAEFLNLNNAPLRYYQAVWDRPIQEESYKWWGLFGVKATF